MTPYSCKGSIVVSFLMNTFLLIVIYSTFDN